MENKNLNDDMSQESPKVEKETKSLKREKPPVKTYIYLVVSIVFLGISFFFYNKYVVRANEIPVKKISYTKDVEDIRQIKEVTIYYPNDSLDSLVSSTIKISDEDFSSEVNSMFINIKSHSNYLVKGNGDKYHPFMDSSIRILNSYLVEDKLYINLSPNIKKLIYSKDQELLILYSIVNTFTSIPGIKKVKFLIDGEEVERLRWYNLKTFYTKNTSI